MKLQPTSANLPSVRLMLALFAFMQQYIHMNTKNRNEVGSAVLVVLVVLAVAIVAGTTVWVYRHHNKKQTTNSKPASTSQKTQKDKTSNTPGNSTPATQWSTYTSSEEKATFKYPTGWTQTKPYVPTNSPTADQTGVTSPSGAITISWVSSIAGTGNEHGDAYPLITVVDKTPISGAPGYYVVSGITTLDGSTYHPWLAVQDANGILTSGPSGDVVTFQGKHNVNSSTGQPTGILFSTSGLRSSQNTPALSQAQATSWFTGMEAQQAKQVLLSFSDPS